MTEQKISSNLVNKDATSEARELMKYLAERYGKGVLSGQQDYGNLNWINENTGRKPAMIGFDLMDYSPSRKERGAISNEIRDAIAWHQQGGIVTLCWHWNAPTHLIDEPARNGGAVSIRMPPPTISLQHWLILNRKSIPY